MGRKLYVGNLGIDATGSDLEKLFAPHGTVQSATVEAEENSGRGKGFGFVEMASEQEARAAIEALHGKEYDGRVITVNEAGDRESPGPRRGGFGDRGGQW